MTEPIRINDRHSQAPFTISEHNRYLDMDINHARGREGYTLGHQITGVENWGIEDAIAKANVYPEHVSLATNKDGIVTAHFGVKDEKDPSIFHVGAEIVVTPPVLDRALKWLGSQTPTPENALLLARTGVIIAKIQQYSSTKQYEEIEKPPSITPLPKEENPIK